MVWSPRFLCAAIFGLAFLASDSSRALAQKGTHSSSGRSSSSAPSASRGSIPHHSGSATHHSSPSVHYNHSYYRYPLYNGYGYFPSYSYNDPLYNYSYYPPLYEARPYYSVPAVMPTAPVDQPAYIEVRLPSADAQVLLDGNQTTSTGTQRVYTSPALAPGEYSYEVSATWKQDNQDVRVVRTIRVTPGRTTLVDFTKVNTADK